MSTSKGYINETNVKEVYLQILRGRDGRDGVPGRDGVKGERGDKGEEGEKGETGPKGQAGPKSGGVMYTHWGRKSCPTGAELLYEGITGGEGYGHTGGGANYVCLPKVPQYISTNEPNWYSDMYGTEYDTVNNIFPGEHNHDAPCAVCYTSTKSVKLMIPARTSCPSSWTIEYKGYLMAGHYEHKKKFMSVLMNTLNLLLGVYLILMVPSFASHVQPVLVYLVHLILTIELLLVLCVLSNNEQLTL